VCHRRGGHQRTLLAVQKLAWDTPVDPSKPIVGEDRFMFLRMPFMQRMSKSQREMFTAHATAQLLSQFLHSPSH
jgi:hypothetical protein